MTSPESNHDIAATRCPSTLTTLSPHGIVYDNDNETAITTRDEKGDQRENRSTLPPPGTVNGSIPPLLTTINEVWDTCGHNHLLFSVLYLAFPNLHPYIRSRTSLPSHLLHFP